MAYNEWCLNKAIQLFFLSNTRLGSSINNKTHHPTLFLFCLCVLILFSINLFGPNLHDWCRMVLINRANRTSKQALDCVVNHKAARKDRSFTRTAPPNGNKSCQPKTTDSRTNKTPARQVFRYILIGKESIKKKKKREPPASTLMVGRDGSV